MQYVCVQAPAKVNLALRVGTPRPDGFHPLDTVFEALNLYETLEAWNEPSGELSLEFSADGFGAGLPVDESNLAIRAGLLLKERCGVADKAGMSRGARMKILKKIPVAGGMAGGSADAAAALVALNELWDLGLSRDELIELGGELGSDVPFAVLGGIAHGTGRGERLVPVMGGWEDNAQSYLHGFVMLINPQGLSTPAVFREFDRLLVGKRTASVQGLRGSCVSGNDGTHESSMELSEASRGESSVFAPMDTADLQAVLCADLLSDKSLDANERALQAVGGLIVNDLEIPAFSLRPDLGVVVTQLRTDVQSPSSVVTAAILSGSGPTVAVLCQPCHAQKLAYELSERYPELTAVPAYGPALGARLIKSW